MTRAVDQAPALSEERAAEDMLHAVRRADWRFLLPEPQLDDVAYVAPHDPELSAALAPAWPAASRCSTAAMTRRRRSTTWSWPRGASGGRRAGARRADAPGRLGLRRDDRPRERAAGRARCARGPRGGRGGLAVAERRRARARWCRCTTPPRCATRSAAGIPARGCACGPGRRGRCWPPMRCRSSCPPPPWSGAGRCPAPGRPREHGGRPARRALRRARPRRLRRGRAARLRPADAALRHLAPRRRARPGHGDRAPGARGQAAAPGRRRRRAQPRGRPA